MIDRDPVVERLERFYQQVGTPPAAPAWRRRASWPQRLPALALVGLLILGALVGISLHSARRSNVLIGPPPSASAAPTPRAIVSAAHFFDAAHGWALTGEGLFTTADGGATWTNISPTGVGNGPTAFFIDANHGWYTSSHLEGSALQGGGGDFASVFPVYQTADGGKTWTRRDLRIPGFQAGGVFLDFVDPEHGWLVAVNTTSSNFSNAQLFATSDGGVTWRQVTIPNGNPVRFINASTGWNVGGDRTGFPGDNALYVTRDGGQSWQRQTIALPAGVNDSFFSLPTFVDMQHGVLPVTFPSQRTEAFYITSDAGVHWELKEKDTAAVLGGQTVTLPDLPMPVAVTGRLSWVIAWGTHLQFFDNGNTVSIEPRGFVPVDELVFVSAKVGWAVTTQSGACLQFKSDCVTYRYVIRTVDGGQTWTPLDIP
jgi:photosystem II stability/assembly factor-like uncharacterized protein